MIFIICIFELLTFLLADYHCVRLGYSNFWNPCNDGTTFDFTLVSQKEGLAFTWIDEFPRKAVPDYMPPVDVDITSCNTTNNRYDFDSFNVD